MLQSSSFGMCGVSLTSMCCLNSFYNRHRDVLILTQNVEGRSLQEKGRSRSCHGVRQLEEGIHHQVPWSRKGAQFGSWGLEKNGSPCSGTVESFHPRRAGARTELGVPQQNGVSHLSSLQSRAPLDEGPRSIHMVPPRAHALCVHDPWRTKHTLSMLGTMGTGITPCTTRP